LVNYKDAPWGAPYAPVIAIDGQAGSGKSTLARRLSEVLNIPTLNSGLYYRAVALWVARNHFDLEDLASNEYIADMLRSLVISVDGGRVILGGDDVTDQLRSKEVQRVLPKVSAKPEVRSYLNELQRLWVDRYGSSIVEGRDIGTVVFPDAYFKVFLTVSSDAQRARRPEEASVVERDLADRKREVAPTIPASDAVVWDTTSLSPEDVLETVQTALATKVETICHNLSYERGERVVK
jgi:cytidylate kinase